MKEISDYLNRLLDALLKKYPLEKLSFARYSLKEKVDARIDEIVDRVAQKQFNALEKNGALRTNGEAFEFGSEILLTSASKEPFKRHAFESAADLNREELQLAKKIDALTNVKWWVRNPENGGFGIQGWKKNKFYPDFIVKTKKGTFLAIEYKGKQLATGEDSDYKRELGHKWEQLSDGNCYFKWVEKRNIDHIINEISKF